VVFGPYTMLSVDNVSRVLHPPSHTLCVSCSHSSPPSCPSSHSIVGITIQIFKGILIPFLLALALLLQDSPGSDLSLPGLLPPHQPASVPIVGFICSSERPRACECHYVALDGCSRELEKDCGLN
jgi:hypothetical protein